MSHSKHVPVVSHPPHSTIHLKNKSSPLTNQPSQPSSTTNFMQNKDNLMLDFSHILQMVMAHPWMGVREEGKGRMAKGSKPSLKMFDVPFNCWQVTGVENGFCLAFYCNPQLWSGSSSSKIFMVDLFAKVGRNRKREKYKIHIRLITRNVDISRYLYICRK